MQAQPRCSMPDCDAAVGRRWFMAGVYMYCRDCHEAGRRLTCKTPACEATPKKASKGRKYNLYCWECNPNRPYVRCANYDVCGGWAGRHRYKRGHYEFCYGCSMERRNAGVEARR